MLSNNEEVEYLHLNVKPQTVSASGLGAGGREQGSGVLVT